MEKSIKIERNSNYSLRIEDIEKTKLLVEENKNESVSIDRELLIAIIEYAIESYWYIKVAGEREI